MGVTLITGASSGIGYSLALRLARTGESVALLSRRYDALARVAEEIEAEAGRAQPFACDVTEIEQVRAAVREVEARLGPVTRLVANAGGGEPTFVDALDAAQAEHTIRLNLIGFVNCVDAVLPGMLARDDGHIVATGSLAGRLGMPTAAAYGAAKAGVAQFMNSLRVDLRGHGIDITLLEPGFVDSRNKGRRAGKRPLCVGREAATERIAKAIVARRRHCAFPWPLVVAVALLRGLPAAVSDRLLAGKGRKRRHRNASTACPNESSDPGGKDHG